MCDTLFHMQGVEVSPGYDGVTPEGFDVITLPQSEYLLFPGEPFQEEDFSAAIEQAEDVEKKYNPLLAGYAWNTSNPRIQLELHGERGYIELVPVKKLEQEK